MGWRARFAKLLVGLGVAGVVLGFLSGIGALAYFAESFPSWTGFGLVPEYDARRNVTQYAPAKTLWDWLNLLLVPLVLTGGGIWFTRAENRQAREIEQNRVVENQRIERERAQDAVLESYLDQMTELLLTRGLRTSLEGDEVRSVARARTLTALRGVDGERKATIVRFLYESPLIGDVDGSGGVLVHLHGAHLAETNLTGVNLRGSNFVGAMLEGVYLGEADLFRADFGKADLRGANLRGANLLGVDFFSANLIGADLSACSLSGGDFSDANLTEACLSEAYLAGIFFVEVREDGNKETDFAGANLSRCRGLTSDQLLQAQSLHGVVLPDYIDPADLGNKWSPPKPEDTPEPKP